MVHRVGEQPCALLVMEHFPLVDAGESELVRGSRSGQGPHEVKPSYLRVLALLFVLLLPMPHPTPSFPVSSVCALILFYLRSVQNCRNECKIAKRKKKMFFATYDETRFFVYIP